MVSAWASSRTIRPRIWSIPGVFRAAGLNGSEVAGGCFCCRFDDFIARADELIDRVRPTVILAEPVGSCTDLVATVLRPSRGCTQSRFEVAPFTVVVDARRALKILGRTEYVGLSERVTYIYRTQQQEAQALALNKMGSAHRIGTAASWSSWSTRSFPVAGSSDLGADRRGDRGLAIVARDGRRRRGAASRHRLHDVRTRAKRSSAG